MKTKKNWIITYNNCEYIKNLYKDYLIIDVNWSYSMNKTKSSSEIIILSKNCFTFLLLLQYSTFDLQKFEFESKYSSNSNRNPL